MSTIDIESKVEQEAPPAAAVAVRDTGGAIARAMSLEELHENLAYIRAVMAKEMKEGQDYGKVPGCGDKPGLFQPGAQKLLMTFQLTPRVRKETLRELPHPSVAGHREYEFTICVVSAAGREWDGVGTCSTLEAKYRSRKAERRCPQCGKNTIIQGKAEYGGGWLCWGKKGGCGTKFAENDEAITSQAGGTVENENPADNWNTVRKMAFKRALVHAAINATNTSELWSQDLEDLPAAGDSEPRQTPPGRAKGVSTPTPGPKQAPTPKPATPQAAKTPSPSSTTAPTVQKQDKCATEATRAWMIKELAQCHDLAVEFFRKVSWPTSPPLMPNEGLADLPLQFVPVNHAQMRDLQEKLGGFGNGEQAGMPYPANPLPPGTTKSAGKVAAAVTSSPAAAAKAAPKDDEAWRGVIVPIPRQGQKRDEYLKHPDTIGSLFDLRHGNDDESADARRRLWGFVNHFEPKGWTKRDGTQMPASQADHNFRAALDQFADWFEKNHPDEKL